MLGTDNFGHDIWSRIVYGAGWIFQIAFLAVLFPFVFGSLMGVITGYFGGKVDLVFMRVVDVLMAFPFLILVIAIMSLLGTGMKNFYIAIGVVGWIAYAAAGARRDTGHAQPRIRAGRHRRGLPGAADCPAPRAAELHPACADLRVHRHGAGGDDGRHAQLLGLGVQPPTP